MNILITSVGRRVELVQEFIKKAKLLCKTTKIFTTDLNPALSAACQVSDYSFKSPSVTDSLYPEYLLDLCKHNNISLLSIYFTFILFCHKWKYSR